MADIVNLRGFRKARARAESEKTAAANRVAFGQSKASRALNGAESEQAARRLDAHRRMPPEGKAVESFPEPNPTE